MIKLDEMLSLFINSREYCYTHPDKRGTQIFNEAYFVSSCCYRCLQMLSINYSDKLKLLCFLCEKVCSPSILVRHSNGLGFGFHQECLKDFFEKVGEEVFEVFVELASVT